MYFNSWVKIDDWRTLTANNSGLKPSKLKNYHIFGMLRTSAFSWYTPFRSYIWNSPLNQPSKLKKMTTWRQKNPSITNPTIYIYYVCLYTEGGAHDGMGDTEFQTILWALIGRHRAQVISHWSMKSRANFEIAREKNLEVDPCMEDPGYSFQASHKEELLKDDNSRNKF